MGFSSVLVLDERPIRAALSEGIDEAVLAADLGTVVLTLVDGSYGHAGPEQAAGTAVLGAVLSRAGTFHSTDLQLLHWTGTQLVTAALGDLDGLADVDRSVPADVFVPALGAGQQSRMIRAAQRHPHTWHQVREQLTAQPLADAGEVSVWWLHHDALGVHVDAAALGTAMLRLMRTHTVDCAAVGSHANALGKLGTLLDADVPFVCAWWGTAAYRLTRLLDSGEEWTQRFASYVASRTGRTA